ncbi:hypothetical protein C8Q80DRAFT_929057 [Daedaleopsis nitida]|nr:hypothetical protein C8Q80DRAFT_929057 [Daedaleopsis nitida]
MRRGFLIKARAPLDSSAPPLAPPPIAPSTSSGTSATSATRSAPSNTTNSVVVKIPTGIYRKHTEAPPTIPTEDLVALGPLRYREYPREPSVPSHIVTGVMFYKATEEDVEKAFPGFVKPFTPPTAPVYKLAPVKGAGVGAIATTDIARGQIIMRERPLLLYPVAMPAQVAENVDAFEYMVNSMRPENKEAVYALKNVKGPEWYSHLKGILDTNSFGFGTPVPGYSGQYAALGRDVSRVNHRRVLRTAPQTSGTMQHT